VKNPEEGKGPGRKKFRGGRLLEKRERGRRQGRLPREKAGGGGKRGRFTHQGGSGEFRNALSH